MVDDQKNERSAPFQAALVMVLAVIVIVGSTLTGMSFFASHDYRIDKKVEEASQQAKKKYDQALANNPTQTPPPTPVPNQVERTVIPANAGIHVTPPPPTKEILATGIATVLTEAASQNPQIDPVLKDAAKDPQIRTAIGEVFESAMSAVWQAFTSFFKVKLTVKEDPT